MSTTSGPLMRSAKRHADAVRQAAAIATATTSEVLNGETNAVTQPATSALARNTATPTVDATTELISCCAIPAATVTSDMSTVPTAQSSADTTISVKSTRSRPAASMRPTAVISAEPSTETNPQTTTSTTSAAATTNNKPSNSSSYE
ncbi:hypothetical protein PI126_g20573 [Phytophthora idaei]|nr:hypothetical protein PI126_g20573 [Phytophthora idaei]